MLRFVLELIIFIIVASTMFISGFFYRLEKDQTEDYQCFELIKEFCVDNTCEIGIYSDTNDIYLYYNNLDFPLEVEYMCIISDKYYSMKFLSMPLNLL